MAIPNFGLSFNGVRFICNLESFRALPYQDTEGNWTVGYGTVISENDAKNKYADGISRDTGMYLFSKHNEDLQKRLSKTPLVSLMQYQLDAIFSLAYNIGINAFLNSTIYKHLVNRDVDLSPWELWNKGNDGNVLQGLVRRRKIELRLFIYGNYSVE